MYTILTLKRPIVVTAWVGGDPDKPTPWSAKALVGRRDAVEQTTAGPRLVYHAIAALRPSEGAAGGYVNRLELGTPVDPDAKVAELYKLANRKAIRILVAVDNIDSEQEIAESQAEVGS